MTRFAPTVDLGPHFHAREATRDDLDDLVHVELLSQGAPWTREVFAREFDLDFSRIWVVQWDPDGTRAETKSPGPPCRLAAYLVFWLVHDEVHILNVVVHPDARRNGLAAGLLDNVIADAQRAERSMLSLEVRVGNAPAQALYRGRGFIQIGQRPNYYADNGEAADVLALLLTG